MKSKKWEDKLKDFCERYDLEIEYIAEILNDPKVVPMIRGKSFEFSAKKYISKILPDTYEVTNPRLNAQTGKHDIDVAIKNTQTDKQYSVECKLASKGSFRANIKENLSLFENSLKGNFSLKVKCMKSRTLGKEAALQREKTTGISANLWMIHKDQYTPDQFDLVVTSIANAFYETDNDGLFYWCPPKDSDLFLKMLKINKQQDAFSKMYVAKSSSLAANNQNGIKCTRKQCKEENCNFIPNYPIIYFDSNNGEPMKPWIPLEKIETLLD